MLSLLEQTEVRRLVAFLRTTGTRFTPTQMAESKSIKCPYCFCDIPTYWEPLYTLDRNSNPTEGFTHCRGAQSFADEPFAEEPFAGEKYNFDWTVCFRDECRQVIVRVRKRLTDLRSGDEYQSEEWFAVPRKRAPRPIDPLVPEEFSKPYIRASLILEDAPDMSGVLSRRILQDLLEKYAGRSEYKLEDRIDKFIEDSAHPSNIKDNLHHLRGIGNFAAHTKSNKETGEIVEVGAEEAEWTLDVIDGLFDYFIVGPEKSRKRRIAWDLRRGPQNPVAKKKKQI